MELRQPLDTLQQVREKVGKKTPLYPYGSLANPAYFDKLLARCWALWNPTTTIQIGGSSATR